jgi:hypothetical protein
MKECEKLEQFMTAIIPVLLDGGYFTFQWEGVKHFFSVDFPHEQDIRACKGECRKNYSILVEDMMQQEE